MCEECYADKNRITPLLNPLECLTNHTQYVCGTCGRCICIEHDKKRGLQRWNFPFKTLEIAKLYLRAADFTTKKPCDGCLNTDKGKPEHCRKCKIKNCINNRGLTYCFECPDYPCELTKTLKKVTIKGIRQVLSRIVNMCVNMD